MIISDDVTLQIIDFNRMDIGDPWEEFHRIVWSAQVSPLFASGQIHGYFNFQVPDEFFVFLKLYLCSNMLSSLPWSIPFGKKEIQTMRDQYHTILTWYDNMKRQIPNWFIPVLSIGS